MINWLSSILHPNRLLPELEPKPRHATKSYKVGRVTLNARANGFKITYSDGVDYVSLPRRARANLPVVIK